MGKLPGTSGPLRHLGALATVVASVALVVAGAWYFGTGSHSLARPPEVAQAVPPTDYWWENARPQFDYENLQPVIAAHLAQLPPGSRVLDLGCGNGVMLASFRGRGWELVGVDISEAGIAQARHAWPDIRFEVGDATGDLSALGTFDAIFSTEVIEHVFLARRFASNAYMLLRPGGLLVLSTPYHGWLKNIAIAVTGNADRHYQPLVDYGHVKFWSVKTLSQLLWEAGFDNVEYEGLGRVPGLWRSLIMAARKT